MPEPVNFIYTGQPRENIARYFTSVKVDPSVKVIGKNAFFWDTDLTTVELNDELECIDDWAFHTCTALEQINIPSTVKVIGNLAFCNCRLLRDVKLHEGLEQIGNNAFQSCISLHQIEVPSTVKMNQSAFVGCSQLMYVTLSEGLECIGYGAFEFCKSLKSIIIPSTVKVIEDSAFKDCQELNSVMFCEGLERIEQWAFDGCYLLTSIRIPSTVKYMHVSAFWFCSGFLAIEFSQEIEQFVDEVLLRDWWDDKHLSLRTYSFLVRCNIPARLGKIKIMLWKINICTMLQCIPEELDDEMMDEDFEFDDDSTRDGDIFLNSIESRVSNYEHLQDDIAPILELALWKAELDEQSSGILINEQMKWQCRENSLSRVSVIIPNALSFL